MKKDRVLSLRFVILYIVIMLILLCGSFFSMRFLMRRARAINSISDETYDRHYAYIHAGADDGMWDNIYAGAAERGEELGVYVENFGAKLTYEYDRNSLIGIAVDASVDGIIIDGDMDTETSAAIARASDKGIPVVTVFSDAPDSDRISYVSISSYTTGRQYGEEIAGLDRDGDIRIYVLMDAMSVSAGQDLTVAGISDVLEESGYSEAYSIEGVYVNNESTFTAEEDIRDIFIRGSLPDVIVALDPIYTKCLFQAAVDYNRVGDVYLYGFNDSEDILEAVSKDLLEATVSVNPTQMGASAVDALEEYLNTGYVSAYILQDTEMITQDMATELMDAEER